MEADSRYASSQRSRREHLIAETRIDERNIPGGRGRTAISGDGGREAVVAL